VCVRKWNGTYAVLYVQVLLAITLGVAAGHFAQEGGAAIKALGDAF
jgi:Na+/H+-dicarboxylate symporter